MADRKVVGTPAAQAASSARLAAIRDKIKQSQASWASSAAGQRAAQLKQAKAMKPPEALSAPGTGGVNMSRSQIANRVNAAGAAAMGMKAGGSVKSSGNSMSKRIDGVAKKGKTRGKNC